MPAEKRRTELMEVQGQFKVPDSPPHREHRGRDGAERGERPGDKGHFVVLSPGNVPMCFCSAWSPPAAPKTGETKIIYAPKQTGENSW